MFRNPIVLRCIVFFQSHALALIVSTSVGEIHKENGIIHRFIIHGDIHNTFPAKWNIYQGLSGVESVKQLSGLPGFHSIASFESGIYSERPVSLFNIAALHQLALQFFSKKSFASLFQYKIYAHLTQEQETTSFWFSHVPASMPSKSTTWMGLDWVLQMPLLTELVSLPNVSLYMNDPRVALLIQKNPLPGDIVAKAAGYPASFTEHCKYLAEYVTTPAQQEYIKTHLQSVCNSEIQAVTTLLQGVIGADPTEVLYSLIDEKTKETIKQAVKQYIERMDENSKKEPEKPDVYDVLHLALLLDPAHSKENTIFTLFVGDRHAQAIALALEGMGISVQRKEWLPEWRTKINEGALTWGAAIQQPFTYVSEWLGMPVPLQTPSLAEIQNIFHHEQLKNVHTFPDIRRFFDQFFGEIDSFESRFLCAKNAKALLESLLKSTSINLWLQIHTNQQHLTNLLMKVRNKNKNNLLLFREMLEKCDDKAKQTMLFAFLNTLLKEKLEIDGGILHVVADGFHCQLMVKNDDLECLIKPYLPHK